MTEEGMNIVNMVKQMKRLCKDISLLLRTVDEQMGEEGWESVTDNRCMAYSSNSIVAPSCWAPSEAGRFYANEDTPGILAFCSVLIDDDRDDYYTVREALVTAGYFDYGRQQISHKVGNGWEYYYMRYYGYVAQDQDNPTADGRILVLTEKEIEEHDWDAEFDSLKCFAFPLVSIKNATDLESKITRKLLDLIPDKSRKKPQG